MNCVHFVSYCGLGLGLGTAGLDYKTGLYYRTSRDSRVVIARGTGGHVLVTEVRTMELNGLFCADVLRPLDLIPPH